MSEIKRATSKYPHVEWLDLKNDGTLIECAIMKRDDAGNTYYFEIGSLDEIDKQRLFRIIVSRNSSQYPLWDLMGQVTLGNGINALEYFHQLVKVLTPSGQILTPQLGVMGAPLGRVRVEKDEGDSEPTVKKGGKKGKKAASEEVSDEGTVEGQE